MTSHNFRPTAENRPFRRYLAATHAARDQYLATTYHAHRQYLTGPWPDREAYQTVENTAWQVHYQASREAWQQYTRELGCPCCTAGGDDCTCADDCGSSRCQAAEPPPPATTPRLPETVTGAMWPASPYDHPQPVFHPTPEGTR